MSKCKVTSNSETEIKCTLEQDPVCGEHKPTLYMSKGKAKNSDGLAATKLSCSITLVEPDSNLNLLGGDNLTFSGKFLPRDVHTSTIEINFDDGQ